MRLRVISGSVMCKGPYVVLGIQTWVSHVEDKHLTCTSKMIRPRAFPYSREIIENVNMEGPIGREQGALRPGSRVRQATWGSGQSSPQHLLLSPKLLQSGPALGHIPSPEAPLPPRQTSPGWVPSQLSIGGCRHLCRSGVSETPGVPTSGPQPRETNSEHLASPCLHSLAPLAAR